MPTIEVKAVGSGEQGAGQASSRALSRAVAGDGSQAMVYLAHLVAHLHQFLMSFDAG